MQVVNPHISFGNPKTILEMITASGLTANLALCLDAGDINSYDGTSQTWTDVSGNTQNFFRGSTSAVEASDPTFNGVAGGKSENEYFSVDGGDYFKQTHSLTFAETWHKNNAAFTFGFIMYAGAADIDAAGLQPIFSSARGNLEYGLQFYGAVDLGAYTLRLTVYNGDGSVPPAIDPKDGFFAGSRRWLCGIISVDEVNGNILAKTETPAATLLTGATYTAPSNNASTGPYKLLSDEIPSLWPSGVRIASIFAWNRVLTSGELDTIFSHIKGRFPTLS